MISSRSTPVLSLKDHESTSTSTNNNDSKNLKSLNKPATIVEKASCSLMPTKEQESSSVSSYNDKNISNKLKIEVPSCSTAFKDEREQTFKQMNKKNNLKSKKLNKHKKGNFRSSHFYSNRASYPESSDQIKRPRLLDMHYTTVTQMPTPLMSQHIRNFDHNFNNLPWHNNNNIGPNFNCNEISPWLRNPFVRK